jgi:DNA-binding NtrC family response regulator
MTADFVPERGDGRRILIVDDDAAVLKALSSYFERLKYEVVRAETGRQAIAAFEAHEPDVTILDLQLPEIGGMEVLEALRRKRAAVILLTGHGDIPTAVKAMQLGAENFLTKPVDMPHLVASVERAIEKTELRRENVRLRKLVPTTRKKVIQLVAMLVLVAGSLLLGRLVGGIGEEQRRLPEIAPTRQGTPLPQRPESLR